MPMKLAKNGRGYAGQLEVAERQERQGGSLRLLIHVADEVVGYEDFQEANEIRLTE